MTTFEVYKLTDLTNNKIYIGATTDGTGARFDGHRKSANAGSQYPIHKAIREHGHDNFKIEVLEMCDNLKEMNEREAYWIAKLSSTNSEIGYNKKVGGGIRFQSEETKKKIGDLHRGKEGIGKKPILQYDKKGVLICEFTSISEAVINTGIAKTSILRVLNKKATRFSTKNPYVWIYKPENQEDIQLKINPSDYYIDLDYKVIMSEECKQKRNSFKNGSVEDLAVPVEQYTITGKLIAKFRSMKEAEKETGVSVATIRKYINNPDYINSIPEGRRKFNWKKGDINDPALKISLEEIQEKSKQKHAIVIQLFDYEDTRVVLHEIIGITKAAQFLKTDSRIIKQHIINNTPYKGYLIKYKES